MKKNSLLCKGRTITSQSRKIVLNVLNALLLSEPNKNTACVKTAELTGVSKTTVQRILKASQSDEGDRPSTPGKNRRRDKPVTDIDALDCGAIRRTVHNLYKSGKPPTLLMILKEVQDAGLFVGKQTSLHSVLETIGFKWKKMGTKKQLTEQAEYVAWRRQYLRTILGNDCASSPMNVVYVSESYLHSSRVKQKSSKDPLSSNVGIKMKDSRDVKIVHAGSKKGFVPDASLIFESKSFYGDYQDDMSEENFEKWFVLKLLPQLNEPTLIVMDNAVYHKVEMNKTPKAYNKKAEIQEWLRARGIPFEVKEIKAELLLRVKQCSNEKRFVVEQLAQEKGHRVVFLPPNHPDLNPIELIWATVRKHVAKNITKAGIIDLWSEALLNVTAAELENAFEHVKKIENEYWDAGYILDDFVPIHLGDSDESSKSSDSDSELSS